jgi:hypothetical protein
VQQAKLWVRAGGDDSYNDFDSLQAVAEYLAEMGASDPLGSCDRYGVTSPGFLGHNYISFYLGDADAQPIRQLANDEHDEINRLLRSSRGQ